MKTLIELYDERPIENVLAVEMFRPETVVYLCPPDIAQGKDFQATIHRYLEHRHLPVQAVFLEVSMYNTEKILKQLNKVADSWPECAVDVTGGTDAALFAAGRLCENRGIPAFTYSRKQKKFFNISGADFADQVPCSLRHTVADCFLMAGGSLRAGRVDNGVLAGYRDSFRPFFNVYLKHKRSWVGAVNYIVAASQPPAGKDPILNVHAGKVLKGQRGKRLEAPTELLRDLAELGYLTDVHTGGDEISFTFRDFQIRAWLRDIGSVLELFVYELFLESNLFNDVITSAVVDWTVGPESVSNEIDVMAMDGVVPVFVSCKTCAVSTEALNELAILRDRFGDAASHAIIVTTQSCGNMARHRATKLGIDVIDLDDLKKYCDEGM